MNSRVKALIKKEFIQFFRDKALVMLVIYIFLEIAICGWALFMDVENLPTAVYDMDKSQYSREIIDKFNSTENFTINHHVNNYDEIDELINKGEVAIAIVIPEDFSLNIVGGRQGKIQLLADGSNSNTATLAIAYASKIVRSFSKGIEIERMGLSESQTTLLPAVNNLVTAWYESGLNFTHFNLVAMVAIAAIFTGVLLAAGAVVREKEVGTLEQLMVTPIKSYELIIAKILPMAVVKMIGLAIGVVIAVFMFDVPVRGSLVLFFTLSTPIIFCINGIRSLYSYDFKKYAAIITIKFFYFISCDVLVGNNGSYQQYA